MSQYKWFGCCEFWKNINIKENGNIQVNLLIEMIGKIERLIDIIVNKMNNLNDFTLDVCVNINKDKSSLNSVNIIELNSFGVQMSCGSCLFHWINDFKQLYGFNKTIQLRCVSKNS